MTVATQTVGRVQTNSDEGVERFVTDTRPLLDAKDGITSRMMSPMDCIKYLGDQGSGRFDLLVDGTDSLGLVQDPKSESGISIAPNVGDISGQSENGAAFANAINTHGTAHVTKAALNQMCSLLGVSGGWKRYEKMQNPIGNFMRDMRMMFGSSDGEASFVARTNSKGNTYIVESFLSPKVDRTDSTVIVGAAMEAVIEQWGDSLRGVEVINHNAGGGSKFRLLFGDPVLNEQETDGYKKLFPMLDLTLSDSRRFHPSAALGLWRMWCLNGCSTKDWDLASWKGSASTSGGDMISGIQGLVNIAFPLAGAVAGGLAELQNRELGMKAQDIVSMIHGRNLIGNALREDLEHCIEQGGGDGKGVHTEWDFFNTWTHSAKMAGTLASRGSNENKALLYGLADGSFTGVAQSGFNRDHFRQKMADLYANNVGDPRSTGLNARKALEVA